MTVVGGSEPDEIYVWVSLLFITILDATTIAFGVAGRTLITNTSDLGNSPSELEAIGRLNLGPLSYGRRYGFLPLLFSLV